MADTSAQFAAAFGPGTLSANLPLRLMRDGLQEVLACSLRCGGQLLDRSLERQGPGVAIELADPFATHDHYCGQCGRRIS